MPKRSELELVFADRQGKIYNFPGLIAAGMKAGRFFELDPKYLLKLPATSELFMLPSRQPVGLHYESGKSVVLDRDPYAKTETP